MTPKQESEILMQEMLVFAKKMLKEYGEFHPFGGMLATDGRISHVGIDASDEFPSGREQAQELAASFHRRAANGDLRAAAIVTNVAIEPPGKAEKVDAIQIAIDHSENYAVHVFFPYSITPQSGLVVERPFATKGNSFAFRRE